MCSASRWRKRRIRRHTWRHLGMGALQDVWNQKGPPLQEGMLRPVRLSNAGRRPGLLVNRRTRYSLLKPLYRNHQLWQLLRFQSQKDGQGKLAALRLHLWDSGIRLYLYHPGLLRDHECGDLQRIYHRTVWTSSWLLPHTEFGGQCMKTMVDVAMSHEPYLDNILAAISLVFGHTDLSHFICLLIKSQIPSLSPSFNSSNPPPNLEIEKWHISMYVLRPMPVNLNLRHTAHEIERKTAHPPGQVCTDFLYTILVVNCMLLKFFR